MQVLDLGDEVVLKIQHLEVSAGITEQFNPLDVLLMKSDLLEGSEQSIVVLCPLSEKISRYKTQRSRKKKCE